MQWWFLLDRDCDTAGREIYVLNQAILANEKSWCKWAAPAYKFQSMENFAEAGLSIKSR